jgi:hypothetical protein
MLVEQVAKGQGSRLAARLSLCCPLGHAAANSEGGRAGLGRRRLAIEISQAQQTAIAAVVRDIEESIERGDIR